MTYDLYFFNILVAKIENAIIEFLNCYGNFVLDAEFVSNQQPELLWQMIEYKER